MNDIYTEINHKMVALTNAVVRYEKQMLMSGEHADISCNDVHIIEAVGLDNKKNMSTIAKQLSVTVGSLTTAMNALVKKGYVVRERSTEDRRVVYISLSEKGESVYRNSRKFHANVLRLICEDCTEEERALIQGLLNRAMDRLMDLDPKELLKD